MSVAAQMRWNLVHAHENIFRRHLLTSDKPKAVIKLFLWDNRKGEKEWESHFLCIFWSVWEIVWYCSNRGSIPVLHDAESQAEVPALCCTEWLGCSEGLHTWLPRGALPSGVAAWASSHHQLPGVGFVLHVTKWLMFGPQTQHCLLFVQVEQANPMV